MIINLLKLFKRRLGEYLQLNRMRAAHPSCLFYEGVRLDSESRLDRHVVLFDRVEVMGSHLGSHTYIQKGTQIFNAEVGPFCSIAGNVRIGLAAHPTEFLSTHPAFYDASQPLPIFLTEKRRPGQSVPRTQIGADVWIGESALILAGLTIGTGSVIAAGAVVTQDVEPYSIVGGIPAKLIRKRFQGELGKRLLRSEWWKLPTEKLKALSPFFENPSVFLENLRK